MDGENDGENDKQEVIHDNNYLSSLLLPCSSLSFFYPLSSKMSQLDQKPTQYLSYTLPLMHQAVIFDRPITLQMYQNHQHWHPTKTNDVI